MAGGPAPYRRSMSVLPRRPLVPAVALCLGLALTGCGGSSTGSAATAVGAPHDVGGVQVFDMTGTDGLMFVPSTLQAHPGQIRINLTAGKATPHNLSWTSLPGAPTIPLVNGGETRTIDLTVSQPGSYPFVCTFHIASGMKGTLVVS